MVTCLSKLTVVCMNNRKDAFLLHLFHSFFLLFLFSFLDIIGFFICKPIIRLFFFLNVVLHLLNTLCA